MDKKNIFKIQSVGWRKKSKIPRVAIAMSGGVDSSSAAKMLKEKGYECLGIFMRLGIIGSCCSEEAARRVCQKLGIKFYPLDLSRQFKKEVKEYFLKSYQNGLTPNPCVVCNKAIKFGALLKRADELGCEYLATGHYIKLKKTKDGARVYRARDSKKDQTYFLYNLTQEQLKNILFPLGDEIKTDIQKKADKNNLPNLKSESQDICFLEGEHNDFLKKNLRLKKGKIKTLDGKVIGEHKGLPLYTIGQRKGIEIGGTGPYYAVSGDYKNNILYVADKADHPSLFSSELVAEKINWISGREPKFPFNCQAVIRYRHQPINCVIKKREKTKSTDCLTVKFSSPQRAVTSGQSVVFYQNNELLGGGIISEK